MHCTQPPVSERITNSYRRQICGRLLKKRNRKNSTISKKVQYRCKNQNSHTPDKHRGYGCFGFYKVSKMDYKDLLSLMQPAYLFFNKVSATINHINKNAATHTDKYNLICTDWKCPRYVIPDSGAISGNCSPFK